MNTIQRQNRQLELCLTVAAEIMSNVARAGISERGAVFTKREVVDFILDLTEYTADRPLHQFCFLEPSFGDGHFLLPAVERLLASSTPLIKKQGPVRVLVDSIRAVELHPASVQCTRAKLEELFSRHGFSNRESRQILKAWLVEGDFLLAELPLSFTHAVGNPPYVRQEMIPDELMAKYRARYSTIFDRADLYIPFMERCLSSLQKGGVLGFICSDRWMKNKYGSPLRAMIAKDYHLACYVDMVDTPAFHSDVVAYPAITVIKREKPGLTRIAHRPVIQSQKLSELAQNLHAASSPSAGVFVAENVVKGKEPWILHSFEQLSTVRRLEAEFPLMEEAGCKVGIGVATGADKAFIGLYENLPVEPDRKTPLITTRDIESGVVRWQGFGVINPFNPDGSLVDLARYPKLTKYLLAREDVIRGRNCAKKNTKFWYRTIDRIDPELTTRQKLLIPDIKGDALVVFEEGRYYPHHNLYHVTSSEWDLHALQAVLLSGIAKLFVASYSTQMRGGYLRFQAQYLRRIRLPHWNGVPAATQKALITAAMKKNIEMCNQITFDLYRLSLDERLALRCLCNKETK